MTSPLPAGVFYCPVHGDLLDGPRSMRCERDGHEFAAFATPSPLPTDEGREALDKAIQEWTWDERAFDNEGRGSLADHLFAKGFRRSVVSTDELADALNRECQSLPNWPGRTHDMVKIEWFARGVVDSAAFIRDHAVSAPPSITDEPVAWAIRGRKTGRIRAVTDDEEYANDCREHYDVIPLVAALAT